MVTVKEATDIVFKHLFKPSECTATLAASTGKVLAETIVADRDFPPFDRVSMDGIAIDHRQWVRGRRKFSIEGIQAAGEARKELQDAGHCMEVMTGAILPSGCDTVVRYEDVEMTKTEATIRLESLAQLQNIHRQGVDAKKGQVLLEPGVKISPSEVALLASVGKQEVRILSLPKVAIISTGDELVDVNAVPETHQIRRSNSSALQAALAIIGIEAVCFHVADEKITMEKKLSEVLTQYDVLILSGGVSKGKFDFVPAILEKIGIRRLFHQVSQRPGKPFWFGTSGSGKVAFALPGNPVSTFICFYRYIKPWIIKSLGLAEATVFAALAVDFSFSQGLTYFLQVSVKNEEGRLSAYPDPGGGSGDFANLKNVSGFLELPLEKSLFKAGEVFPYISFRD